MIVSHKHKFIFVAIPRTGTHYIRTVFSDLLGPDDWEQENLFGTKRLPIKVLAQKNHGHISISEIKNHLSPDVFDNYLKFAFIRNPFDRFVSACFFVNRGNKIFPKIAKQWMKWVLETSNFAQRRILFKPQSNFIGASKQNQLDFIGSFENLNNDLQYIIDRLGIQNHVLNDKVVNASDHMSYEKYFDEELSQLFVDVYEKDKDIIKNYFKSE